MYCINNVNLTVTANKVFHKWLLTCSSSPTFHRSNSARQNDRVPWINRLVGEQSIVHRREVGL